MLDVTFFDRYIQKNISVIPVRKKFNEKKDRFEGKFPCITGWNELCDELPDDDQVESWGAITNCSGVAIVCGEASNIGCIDIDTTDIELTAKILAAVPHTPCRIMGDPARKGGKLLYRLTDSPASYKMPSNPKQKVNNAKKETVTDVFYGNAYIVVPPSLHSTDKNGGDNVYYRWYDKSLDEIGGVENLPIMPLDIRYKIEQIVQGESATQVNINLSNVDTKSAGVNNRHLRIVNYASALIRSRTSLDIAIASILRYDKDYNNGNEYFIDKTKGHQTNSRELNAIKFYTDIVISLNRGKEHSLEIPKMMRTDIIPVSNVAWQETRSFDSKVDELGDIDSMLIPQGWGRFISDVAGTNGVSKEICLFYMLTQLSSLIGNKRKITVKKKNKSWEEAHNIWSIYVSPSGTRKSQVTKTLSFPLSQIQKRIDTDHKEVAGLYIADESVRKIQIKELKKKLEQEVIASIDDGLSYGTKKRIENINEDIRKTEEASKPPAKQQLTVQGTTVEKLIEIISVNKSGTFLEYNELSQLTSLFKKKGYEILKTFLMDSWDGLKPYSYQTKGSGEVFIEKNCTSLFSCVQNSIFERELQEISMGINDDGFYQRSFIVMNDAPVALALDENFDVSKYPNITEAFEKAESLEDDGSLVLADDDAYALYMSYEQRIMDMAKDASNGALGSFWSKFTGKTVKIASLLEFVECKHNCHKSISYESMLMAIKLMERQVKHIEKVFPDRIEYHCNEIIRACKFGTIRDGIQHSKMCQKFKFLDNPKTYDQVIMKLYDYNYISCFEDKELRYYFNPEIHPKTGE